MNMNIKIREKPIYTIVVYEGSVIIDDIEYEFFIDSGEGYAEIEWKGNTYVNASYILRDQLASVEDEILKEFEKMKL